MFKEHVKSPGEATDVVYDCGEPGSEERFLGSFGGDDPPLLPDEISEVEGCCIEVKGPCYFKHLKSYKLEFRFKLTAPPEVEGKVLTKWVRWNLDWESKRSLPPSSSLWRLARLAGLDSKGRRFQARDFKGKIYCLEVGRVKGMNGKPGLYTTVKDIKGLVAG